MGGGWTIPAYAAPVTETTPSQGQGGAGEVEVRAERLVAGGDALARRDDGRVVLVAGALPGETVRVRVERRRGADRGTVVAVVEPSPERVTPRCPHRRAGCGGCGLAELAHPAQLEAKVALVADALGRLGGLSDPDVRPGPALSPWGFRTSLRVGVTDGAAGLRRGASHELVIVEGCLVAHPRLAELLAEGRFDGAEEVTLRVGAATGERLALVAPSAADVRLPGDVRVVGLDELRAGRRGWLHEVVAGRTWRISAESFFQTRPDGAEALVAEVAAGVLGGPVGPRTLVDAYCGVGLFAGSLAGVGGVLEGWRVVAVERSASSVADARHNLADLDARVVRAPVERFHAPAASVVVADPSRSGLGPRGVERLVGSGAGRIVLVSCDAASAGRDAALLVRAGYRHLRSVVVDLFPHTPHVEVVGTFERARPAA